MSRIEPSQSKSAKLELLSQTAVMASASHQKGSTGKHQQAQHAATCWTRGPFRTGTSSNDYNPSANAVIHPAKSHPMQQRRPSYEELWQENCRLREQLARAQKETAEVRQQLKTATAELSALPAGKISQIPIQDMIAIMKEYGSEVSTQQYHRRNTKPPQPASIVRQFRRWNPEFLTYFVFRNGKWVPKLGKQGELRRRQAKRIAIQRHKDNPPL